MDFNFNGLTHSHHHHYFCQMKITTKLTSILFIILITLINFTLSQSSLCPSMCNCMWKNGKQTANCERQGLIAIPTGITPSTQVLYLFGNNFQILPSRVFQERGLINLQKIFLSECKLGEIAKDAFVQLTNLVELDLSTNLLTSVPSQALSECPSLRRLVIHSNPIRVIKSDAFINLNNLVFLDLSSSQLDLIEPHAFRGLSKLQFLKLESNRLQTLSPGVLMDLPALYQLDLHHNQWNCDCELKPAREWMIRNNVPQSIPPTCTSPKRLAGLMWNSIELDEFACPPQFQTKTTDYSQYIGNSVMISCTVTGTPVPSITWLSGDGQRNFANESVRGDRIMITEDRKEYNITSTLTLNNLNLEDSQHFICSAENRGGIEYKNFTLTVLSVPIPSPSTVLGLVFAFVLVTILIIVMILLRAKKSSFFGGVHVSKLSGLKMNGSNENPDKKLNHTSSLSINKSETALIYPSSNYNDIKGKDSNGSSSGYGSGLMTPDVAKTNYNYHMNGGGPRVNLVTSIGQQPFNSPVHYLYSNNYNYQDVYDEQNINMTPSPSFNECHNDNDNYKNYDSNISESNFNNHCYSNEAMKMNQIGLNPELHPNWNHNELDYTNSKQTIVRYSPELNIINVNQLQNGYGLSGTQV